LAKVPVLITRGPTADWSASPIVESWVVLNVPSLRTRLPDPIKTAPPDHTTTPAFLNVELPPRVFVFPPVRSARPPAAISMVDPAPEAPPAHVKRASAGTRSVPAIVPPLRASAANRDWSSAVTVPELMVTVSVAIGT
jgi:hypothetical protein